MRHHRESHPQYYIYLTFECPFSAIEIKRNAKSGSLGCIVYPCEGALLFAVYNNREKCVNHLIELGADVNEKGVSLLRAGYHYKSISRSLLCAGASGLGILEDDFAIRRVCKEWNDDTLRMLVDSIPKNVEVSQLYYTLKVVSCTGNVLLVKLLIERGAQVTDEVIRIAQRNGHTPLVEFLRDVLLKNKE